MALPVEAEELVVERRPGRIGQDHRFRAGIAAADRREIGDGARPDRRQKGGTIGGLVVLRHADLDVEHVGDDLPPQPALRAAADEARNKLESLIRAFEKEDQPYTSLNLSMWSNRYGSYDDLARIKEWSAAGGLGIEEWQ
mgnify:CR=1 FL=1